MVRQELSFSLKKSLIKRNVAAAAHSSCLESGTAQLNITAALVKQDERVKHLNKYSRRFI